jgi:hypothetical protein
VPGYVILSVQLKRFQQPFSVTFGIQRHFSALRERYGVPPAGGTPYLFLDFSASQGAENRGKIKPSGGWYMWQVIVFTALLAPVFAATPFKKALDTKKNIYIDKGTFIGGQAGQAFSLLKVRSQADPKKGMERVVLNIGDEQGRILKGRVKTQGSSSAFLRSVITRSLRKIWRTPLKNLLL